MEADSDAADDALLADSRSYQLEMFQESLRRNVIVAIIWFLAPSVFLCYQQFYAISSQIPSVQGRLIAGDTDIRTWSTQAVWDNALRNIRFVVATHDVLLEALKHGFVRMHSIPLLVFDEVHSCVRNHPGSLIMRNFYTPAMEQGEPVPSILGLTASPVQGKKLEGIENLERTMHATCITPTRHRQDLVAHTRCPTTLRHIYSDQDESPQADSETTPYFSSLCMLHMAVNFGQIWPEVELITETYARMLEPGDIEWTQNFIKRFFVKASSMFLHLGSWAAEYYVHKIIRRCIDDAVSARHPLRKDEPYLLALLRQLSLRGSGRPSIGEDDVPLNRALSPRVLKLIEILSNHQTERPTGIVFVKEQPMAAVLAHLISVHPLTKTRFTAGHVVGMAKNNQISYLDGLLTLAPKDGRVPLLDFRHRKLNLLVATSVIEEGIDIPDCNFVICVDEVTNLKSFIQRRGRARDKNSELHLVMSASPGEATGTGNLKGSATQTANAKKQLGEWEVLEAEMKKWYESEHRENELLGRQEAASALDDGRLQPLLVKATGARLTARDAKQHLSHFCATVSSTAYVESRPIFTVHENDSMEERYRASVQLPMSLPQQLRGAESAFAWQSSSDAIADAAFVAYKALYDAGLLTDNLLAPKAYQEPVSRFVEGRSGLVNTHESYRPWPIITRAWEALLNNTAGPEPSVFRHAIRISDDQGHELFDAQLILPCPLPEIKPFELFWTAHTERPWTVQISAAQRQPYGHGPGQYHDDQDHAVALMQAAFGHRWPLTDTHRPVRVVFPGEHLSREHIATHPFNHRVFSQMTRPLSVDSACLVRDADNVPYYYEGYLNYKPPLSTVRKIYEGFIEAPEHTAHVVVRSWPKITGMLYNAAKPAPGEAAKDDKDKDEDDGPDDHLDSHGSSAKLYPRVLPAAICRIDDLPASYVQFGAILPSLTPVLEVALVAVELLSSTRLCQLPIRDVSLVATAISAAAARLPTNYEHLEFRGDSILKVLSTVNCAAQNPNVPEGHLSLYKDRLVANSRLSRAALEIGLDRFIVTKQWALKRWKRYCDKLSEDMSSSAKNEAKENSNAVQSSASAPEKKHSSLEMSTKTLADVVEALIGACYVDGGMAPALQCIGLFLPDAKWLSLGTCREMLFEAAPDKPACEPPPGLEELIGHTFTKKSLLIEAITHASLPSNLEGACMERIEFIGDAILDHVIVQTLASVQPPLSHQRMHLLRTTLANYAFLAFTTMMLTISEPAVPMVPTDPLTDVNGSEGTVPLFTKSLSTFMRHSALRELGIRQQLFAERCSLKKEAIMEQLWTGKKYPWKLLLGLGADKFHSDILEAVIGAVWVDSGSMSKVEALLEKVGILPYLRRAVEEDVHLLHPKEELGKVTGDAKIRYEVSTLTRAEALKLDASRAAQSSPEDVVNDYGKRARTDDDPAMEGGPTKSSKRDEDDNAKVSLQCSGLPDAGLDHEAKIRRRTIVGDVMDDVGYRCRLFFNGKCAFEVSFCNTREEAEATVADMALDAWWAGRLVNEK
ncbi:Dicer-like protein 2 [Sporothrix epigloea]|uniref:Dicer-like protein 2 n=1 Tax=Sporothrix epigloea TaxID=1892477 RepID=A0ABP0E6W8_9PEZI